MSTERTFVIVGASLAGPKAAETLRLKNSTGASSWSVRSRNFPKKYGRRS